MKDNESDFEEYHEENFEFEHGGYDDDSELEY